MPGGDLKTLADTLLAAATSALDLTEAGAPSRRFVSHAVPAYDCPDQLCIYVNSITRTPSGPTPGPARGAGGGSISDPSVAHMNQAALRIVSLRCYPVIDNLEDPPPPADIDAAAAVLCEDAWVLWCYLHRRISDGSLLSGAPTCRACLIGDLNPVPAQGATAGWQLDVIAHLDGYDPAA